MEAQTAPIRPQRFWLEYVTLPSGEIRADEWVEWVKKGVEHAPTTADKVSRAMKDRTVWEVLAPHYKAWKDGQDAPVDGTPLDAAPFMTPELVAQLRRLNVRSVEDLAGMEDGQIAKAGIPGLRAIQGKAVTYVRMRADQAPVLNEIAQLKAQLEAMAAEKAEIEASRDSLADEAGRKRRARPIAEALG